MPELYGETLPEPGSFAGKVQALDLALTGKLPHEVARSWRNSDPSHHDPASWAYASDCYYLSDGGYSRIGYNVETGHLFLTSNSREAVRQQWRDCKELIAGVEQAITE